MRPGARVRVTLKAKGTAPFVGRVVGLDVMHGMALVLTDGMAVFVACSVCEVL